MNFWLILLTHLLTFQKVRLCPNVSLILVKKLHTSLLRQPMLNLCIFHKLPLSSVYCFRVPSFVHPPDWLLANISMASETANWLGDFMCYYWFAKCIGWILLINECWSSTICLNYWISMQLLKLFIKKLMAEIPKTQFYSLNEQLVPIPRLFSA